MHMINKEKTNYIVLTGAPGSGKTSLLSQLTGEASQFIAEPAREIISEQRKIGGTALPDKDALLFAEKLLSRSIENFESSLKASGIIFFDRGIPDVIAYARWYQLRLEVFEQASLNRKYNSQVFILPPWKEIYVTDEERKMTFEEAVKFHEFLEDAYLKAGYKLVEVPQSSLKIRADFIKNKVLN